MNEVKSITTAEGPTKLLNLQLKDLGDSLIDVALWGKLAEDVYSNIKSQPSGPVVFLGSLMKTLLYQGKGTVQSSKFTTKAYINSPLPEILQFQEANKFLLDLDGRNYVFKIMVKDEAKYNQSSTYKVISLTDVPDVIQSFSESAYTLNAIEQEIITVSGNSVGTSIGTSTQAEINFVDMEKLDNNEDNAYNVSTPKPTTKRSLATSKDVQQSSTKPKLMSKAQIKKEKK
ncbi:hypothetical protein ARALYDRAFT_482140 [Arabidopsis lyrata subsp. lyrata]|uniref:Uncharacterized protein n=1 Tax=Arabidopsis lyrata subsp. lyrata TaxID=81972 RepID=D7LED5_ARALL|nr:hypothetical protein ARALYDRAFT_482140 [Arabidopsis lyrata subsp. lyrata]